AVVEAATLLHIVLVSPQARHGLLGAGTLGVLVAVYTVAVVLDRRRSLMLTAAVVVLNATAFALVNVVVAGGAQDSLYGLVVSAVAVAGAWALGDNLETRRAYLAALEERAAHLEREQEERARGAVLDERSRIARELHDVVAHHVSAIAVQAGAAAEVAERDPPRTRRALGAIQETARVALAEMRAIVGVLRESEDGEGAPIAPQPTLGALERLVDQTRAAGLDVDLVCRGTPRQLPEAVDLSAYRIVQEALTNTLKHARATRVTVTIGYQAAAVDILVTNDGVAPNARPVADGRGLVGMRERVALFHGQLEAGPSGGGFRVHARLPVGGDGR
ncbi:MAG: sensor histidine kinase, partial [Candidatus Dormibacteraeota bacterium]|nr:sensor histidine kinase [Candidatus Dormibacteraeota bacterium]MBO0762058.1 sensor histidine kinase [Candidatus Dormibacteraeota bacterium]